MHSKINFLSRNEELVMPIGTRTSRSMELRDTDTNNIANAKRSYDRYMTLARTPKYNTRIASMIGLVVVTNGRLAEEFLIALEHVVGKQSNIETISIFPEDDIEASQTDIVEAVTRAGSGKGVIILTDMFGGTPSNLAISLLEPGSIEIISGVNLPMLVKLASTRTDASLIDAVEQAQEAGRKYIQVASELLGRSPPPRPWWSGLSTAST
jgi:PTS system mannose-specific IIA component